MEWTEASLKSHFKSMTNGISIVSHHVRCKPLNTPFDDAMLKALVAFHPMCNIKGLDKVKYFEVRTPPPYRKPTLFFLTTDNRLDDVSYKMCLQNLFGRFKMDKMIREEVLFAFRNEAFKYSTRVYLINDANGICSHCGQLCHEIHIDHYITPFSKLLDDFMNIHKLSFSGVEVINDEKHLYKLKDSDIKTNWVAYHDKHATLRVLCKQCNTTFGSYGYQSQKPPT